MKSNFLFLIFIFLASCSSQKATSEKKSQSNFFSENVTLESSCLLSSPGKVQLLCHRVYAGQSIALASRVYSKSGNGEAEFKKITILLPSDIKSGDKLNIDNKSVLAFYSRGLSFGVGKRGCVGNAIKGTITILSKTKDEVSAAFNLQFQLKSPLNWPNECGNEELNESMVFKYIPFDSLGPWEGRVDANNSYLPESYPQ